MHAADAAPSATAISSHRSATLALAFPLCTIVWGALAFGGVYPWAYWPLATACVLSGAFGLIVARRANVRTADRSFIIALVVLASAILVQLIPLPTTALRTVSPNSIDILGRLDVSFAAGLVSQHPISLWPRDTITALALYGSLALLMVGTSRLLAVTGSRKLVEALTVFGVVLAFIGIVQKPLYSGAIYGLWELEVGRMPFGPFVNRNHFAGWMVMALPLTLALLAARIDRSMRGLRPGWRHKVLWFSSPEASQLILFVGAAVVMALALMLTMSRSGILAFLLSLLVLSWFIIQALESRRRRLAAAVMLVMLVTLAFAWAGPDAVASRFASGDWGEFNNRRGAWKDAWGVIRMFPFAGTGLNTYWAAALFYQRHELAQFFAQAHNDYLQLAAEGGLLLIVPAAICLVIFVRNVRRAIKDQRGSTSWWLRAGAVTALLAIACQESVEFSLQMPGNAVLFAVVCAIALHRPQGTDSSGGSVVTAGGPRVVDIRRSGGPRRAASPRAAASWLPGTGTSN
jgi:O-antigen ligase